MQFTCYQKGVLPRFARQAVASYLTPRGYEGAAAAKRVQAALSKKLSALQQDAGDLGVHELFELASPSGSLVGFSIKGELASGATGCGGSRPNFSENKKLIKHAHSYYRTTMNCR